MVVIGERRMIPTLSRIWETCFGDSPEYIHFFMERRFSSCYPIVWLENSEPVGVVYLLPCFLERKAAFYGYAGGVFPEHRGKGIFEKLLLYAEKFCWERNATFIFVPISGSEEYYQKRGFRSSFFFSKLEYKAKGEYMPIQLTDAKARDYTKIRDQAFSAYPYLRWDENAVEYALDENRFCGGFAKIVTLQQDYLLFGKKNESVLEIWETTLTPELSKQVVPFLCWNWCTEKVIFHFPVTFDSPKIPNGGTFGHLQFKNGWMGLSLA